jgi:uncharacterized protein with LGFP repeats
MADRSHRSLLDRIRRGTSALALVALVATPLHAGLSEPAGDLQLVTPSGHGPIRVQSLDIPAATTAATPRVAPNTATKATQLLPAAQLHTAGTQDYSMVGVTWDDPSAGHDLLVEVRTHGERGWTDWTHLEQDADQAPSAARTEGARGGTAPLWVGPSRGVQVRVLAPRGKTPAGLKVELVDPGTGPTAALVATTSPIPSMPRIITRRQWGADPRLSGGCWTPIHGKTVQGVVVHHTVNANNYTPAQSDDIVRGIYAYHTQSQGWCDIGYNFLIDKFGQVYEGRAGGIRTPVRGAHAGVAAVNEATTGVSLIGNFETAYPTAAMKDALVRFVTWRVQTYYRAPHGTTVIGGIRYPVIAGHRDVHSTACPGQHVYEWLPRLRDLVAERIGTAQTANHIKWERLGGAAALGEPYIGERPRWGGRVTEFDKGSIYYSDDTGPREVHGAILMRYRALGEAGSVLGFPTSDERIGAVPGTHLNMFANGTIYHSRATGAHEVHGRILAHYRSLGVERGFLGLPTSDEVSGQVEGVRLNTFQGGTIYFSRATRARSVHGAILAKYRQLGAEASVLGLPVADEQDGAIAGTHLSEFSNGRIYHSRATGAHGIHGLILTRYLRLGAESSSLGLPTSDEYSWEDGRRNDFENGYIYRDQKRRITRVVANP